MDLFCLICKKILDFEIVDTHSEYKLLKNKGKSSSFIYFLELLNGRNKKYPFYKFKFFKEMMNNIFISDEKKGIYLATFSKIQHTYHVLTRLFFQYKKKCSKIQTTHDMYFNPITVNTPRVLSLYHNNTNYLFTCSDLTNIIHMSLVHNYLLFADPLVIKNPYNNLPFNKSILYTIYFFMKDNSRVMPDLYEGFFRCDFNLSMFAIEYEIVLREHAIKDFLEKSSEIVLYKEIKQMLLENPNRKKIVLHKEFPKNVVVKTLKPLLRLFVYSKYSLNKTKRLTNRINWERQLYSFIAQNPMFGRKIIKNVIIFPTPPIQAFTSTNVPVFQFNTSFEACDYLWI